VDSSNPEKAAEKILDYLAKATKEPVAGIDRCFPEL
jgi:hypothetical protein